MRWQGKWAAALGLLILLGAACLARPAAARPWMQGSPQDLINAVNALRTSRGLGALSTHPVLMQVAQSQADALLATGGAVGHTRPNGMTFTQQLLLLGYPLSGDLSLGGYRSENFIFGYQLSPQDAVEAWLGDGPHTNTMLASERSDIGAGVATAGDGSVYYVIDTALQTSSGLPQSEAGQYLPGTGSATMSADAAISQYIVPIAVSTARANGDVYHKVQYGQTLWGIAIEYGTKIEQIRSLNNLGSENTVYPNQLLLVKRGATQPAAPPTILPVIASVAPAVATFEDAGILDAAPTANVRLEEAVTPETQAREPGNVTLWAALLVMLLLVIGGFSAAWFIRDPGE